MSKMLSRGKRCDNGEWAYGYYVCVAAEKHLIYTGKITITNCNWTAERYEVVPETVGRYSEITDINGKKIFEGDIIVCKKYIGGNWIDYYCEIGYVEMKHGAFGLHRKQGYYRPFKDWLEDYEYEVIGNMHDNPEFVKNGEQE